ncbi:hypothetical protein [uncultured Bacteroides sp.]|uniref:hypothetical protein n=1 Tax=uncultured Bacteroides sp. TaxID=162156 RepID=UPI002596CAA0|nr:hypothetical protein [uncultured Bacteroides sp.]
MENKEVKIISEETVRKIKLCNDAGAVTMLKGYVKRAENVSPYKCGRTDKFPVGESGTLDMNNYNPALLEPNDAEKLGEEIICEGDLLTAYAAVSAHDDEAGEIWFHYSSDSKKIAVFSLSGALWNLKCGFIRLEDIE